MESRAAMTPAALAALRLQDRLNFKMLSDALQASKYTGALVLHFSQGNAVIAELPAASHRIKLDDARKKL